MEEIKCDEVKKNLSAYFDNELDNDEYLNIEHHLRHCQICREQLKDIILLSNTLKDFSARIKYDLADTSDNVLYNLFEIQDLNCDQVNQKLFDYAHGDLEIQDFYKVEEHINNCSSCRKELETIEDEKKAQRKIYIVPIEENNSSCKNIRPRLQDFLDKELSKEESAIIAKHLLSCGDCRKIYDNLKITQSAIKNYLNKNTEFKDVAQVSKIKQPRFWITSLLVLFLIAILGLVSTDILKAISDKAEIRIDKVKDATPVKPIYVNLGKKE